MNFKNFLSLYLRGIGFLIRKELLALLKDKRSRTILVVPVFFQSLVFGYAASFDLRSAPYAVVDACGCKASADFLAKVDASGVFRRIATLASASQIEEAVLGGDAAAVLSIPPDFEAKLRKGEASPVQLILDGRNSVTSGLASAYLSSIASSFGAEFSGRGAAVSVERRVWFNPNLDTRWTILVSLIAVLSFIQTLLTAAFSVAREREQGTFDQLLVTPLSPAQILVGKAVPPVLVGLVQSTLILLIIRFWFGIPMAGDGLLLYAGLLVFNLAVVGIGLSISALASTMQQAMLYAFFVSVPSIVLAGFITPVSNMSVFLQQATYAVPLRFGVDIAKRVYLQGAGLAEVWPSFLPLAAVAVISLPLAAWLFRHKLS